MESRIRKIRKAKGLSGTAVAEKLGVSAQYYYDIETGKRNLSGEIAAKLAVIFDVTSDYLLGLADDPKGESISKFINENFETHPIGKRILVPIVGTVKAGPDGLAYEDHMGMEWADEDSINGGEYVYLVVKGDSMIREGIMPGDLALVRIQPDVNSGDLAVVIVDKEEGTLKRVLKRGTGIILQSANPNYPDRLFAGEDVERVKIVGKVKEIKRKF